MDMLAQAVETSSAGAAPLWPLLIYALGVAVLVGGMMGASYLLGERSKGRARQIPYESGILPTGSARLRMTAKFYLIAMFFVIFDLEAVFIFAWVVAFRELGWAGYIEILVFIVCLVGALVYLWREGALDWGTKRKKVESGE